MTGLTHCVFLNSLDSFASVASFLRQQFVSQFYTLLVYPHCVFMETKQLETHWVRRLMGSIQAGLVEDLSCMVCADMILE